MAAAKTLFNDKQGARGRQARCFLVTADGRCHLFVGSNIPGICGTVLKDSTKDGKWSASVWEITHAETTTVVSFMDDWELGVPFPATSWEAAFFSLAEQAPLLSKECFERCIRELAEVPNPYGRETVWQRMAGAWDAARMAEEEFGMPATACDFKNVEEARARIASEKLKYEQEQAEKLASSPFKALLALKGKPK